ncbi:MAG: glycosyltransferase [Nitratireductor rhodophyticola]|uniref:glycosyltransferase n=1 Tax=Nitratireductor rhodophyticola TaxID=2854036 RepID=UPI0032D9742A
MNKENLTCNKTSIIHDYFAIRGGGERLVLTLARELENATLVYGYRTDDSFGDFFSDIESTSLNVPGFLRKPELRIPALALKFSMQRRYAASFPVRIYSGVSAPFAAPRSQSSGVDIFYCHTPPRFLFDQRALFTARQGTFRRLVTRPLMHLFEKGYRNSVVQMDLIVANSENTRKRIKRYLDRDSVVVYPPVDIDQFKWKSQDDYYLSTARLTPLKRVEKIVEAFLAMPDKKLVVASGGDDLERLKQMAGNAPNIEFRGWVSDQQLKDLVGRAIATIYLPVDEDFGISPVESMAAGKPVIGVREGGLLETIENDKTGLLLKPDFSIQDIADAVGVMTKERAIEMRSDCETRAQQFSRERFVTQMQGIIRDLCQQDADKS